MSETVLVALVTFLSGAVGAAVGAWGVIKSSERASKGQMQQAIMQEFFRTRVSAYQAVFETQISMSAAQYSAESVAAFVTALNAACVVASPQTLSIWWNCVLLRRQKRCGLQKSSPGNACIHAKGFNNL